MAGGKRRNGGQTTIDRSPTADRSALPVLDSGLEAAIQNLPDGFIILNEDWRFRYVNASAAATLGFPPEELAGQVLWDLMPEALGSRFHDALIRARDEQITVPTVEFYPRRHRLYRCRVYPVPGGVAVIASDVTDSLGNEETLSLMMAGGDIGTWDFDLDSQICTVDKYLAKVMGLGDEELSLPSPDFMRHVHPEDQPGMYDNAANALRDGSLYNVEFRWRRPDGKTIWMISRGRYFHDEAGRPRSMAGVNIDITARRKAEERYRMAASAAGFGAYLYDGATGISTWSPELYAIHGIRPDEEITFELVRGLVHPDDLPRYDAHLQAAAHFPDGAEYQECFRFVRPDGETRWIKFLGKLEFDGEGQSRHVTRGYGMVVDITDSKLLELELQQRVDKIAGELRVLSENVPAFFSFVDRDMRYKFVNRAYEEAFGREASDIQGERVKDLLPHSFKQIEPHLSAALEGTPREFEMTVPTPKTGARVLHVRHVPRWENGEVTGVFILASDITEERRLQKEVLEAAEREKATIGGLIHDTLLQELTALSLFAKALENRLRPQHEIYADQVANLVSQIMTINNAARRISHGLAPITLDEETLHQALHALVDVQNELRKNVRCELESRTPTAALNAESALQLYYIAQESLFNALRHGEPTHVKIALWKEAGEFCLSVTDNGRGRAAGLVESNSVGIRSMRYRARLLDGSIFILDNPAPGQTGLQIICRVPIVPLSSTGK